MFRGVHLICLISEKRIKKERERERTILLPSLNGADCSHPTTMATFLPLPSIFFLLLLILFLILFSFFFPFSLSLFIFSSRDLGYLSPKSLALSVLLGNESWQWHRVRNNSPWSHFRISLTQTFLLLGMGRKQEKKISWWRKWKRLKEQEKKISWWRKWKRLKEEKGRKSLSWLVSHVNDYDKWNSQRPERRI